MSKKRVLIITYYWPPSGGSGVQRWLKFAKYLRKFGWEPIIYTPSNPEYPSEDKSFLKDIPKDITIIKRPIREPYKIYRFLSGKKSTDKIQSSFLSESPTNSRIENFSRWLRGNLFIPDARKFWIKPSIIFLSKWLKNNPVDIVVSTGPPHSMHLIALGLKKKLGIKWLADFRDPWTQIDFYHYLMLSKRADTKHKRLEKTVLTNADIISTVSKHCAQELEKIANKEVKIVTNGYDPEDFRKTQQFDYRSFSITHLGSMNNDRNPEALWIALRNLLKETPGLENFLKIKLIGKTDFSVIHDIEKYDLLNFLENIQYLPHNEAISLASNSAILLLPINNTPNIMGIMTGKIFEYLALKRPILLIGNNAGDAAKTIEETKSGKSFGYEETHQIQSYLEEQFIKFKNKSLEVNSQNLEKYSRIELSKKMADLFLEALSK